MIEALILIPIRANDGTLFGRGILDEIRARLASCGGGVTIARDVDGIRVGPDGLEYAEGMRPYIVVLDSWWRLSEFLAIAEWALEAFDQRAVAGRRPVGVLARDALIPVTAV